MLHIKKGYIKLYGLIRGQTMTEYAMILAAVAIVVYIFYQSLGNSVITMVNSVDTLLTTSAS